MTSIVPSCAGCHQAIIQALIAAVDCDDLDQAIELGLLNFNPPDLDGLCLRCATAVVGLLAAKNIRLSALAARERYRQRQTRLLQRTALRESKRIARETPAAKSAVSTLPPAAAAALARAKARAANRSQSFKNVPRE